MDYIINENKLTRVISKYLNLSLDGFEVMDYNWADFNCGWGVCCDPYAIGFVLPDNDDPEDYLFKLVDGENYDDDGDYPEELKGELPEVCENLPDLNDPRFDTIVMYNYDLIDRLTDMFGDVDVWGDSFLNLVNQIYGINAKRIHSSRLYI